MHRWTSVLQSQSISKPGSWRTWLHHGGPAAGVSPPDPSSASPPSRCGTCNLPFLFSLLHLSQIPLEAKGIQYSLTPPIPNFRHKWAERHFSKVRPGVALSHWAHYAMWEEGTKCWSQVEGQTATKVTNNFTKSFEKGQALKMLCNKPMVLYEDFSGCEKQTVGLHITWWQNWLNKDREISNVFHAWSCCVWGISAKPTGNIPTGKRNCPLVLGVISWSQKPQAKALVYNGLDSTSIWGSSSRSVILKGLEKMWLVPSLQPGT